MIHKKGPQVIYLAAHARKSAKKWPKIGKSGPELLMWLQNGHIRHQWSTWNGAWYKAACYYYVIVKLYQSLRAVSGPK